MKKIFHSQRSAAGPANVYQSDLFRAFMALCVPRPGLSRLDCPGFIRNKRQQFSQICACQILLLFISPCHSLPLPQKEIPAAHSFFLCQYAFLTTVQGLAGFLCQICKFHTCKNTFHRISLVDLLKEKTLKEVKRKTFCRKPGRDISGPEQVAGRGAGIEPVINLF